MVGKETAARALLIWFVLFLLFKTYLLQCFSQTTLKSMQQPAPWLFIPHHMTSGVRDKLRGEPELSSGNRQQLSFNPSCTDCPWYSPCSTEAASPSPSRAISLGRREFTCAMNGVMRAPTLAIPLHVPSPKARVAVG